jgi:hypothetical protein
MNHPIQGIMKVEEDSGPEAETKPNNTTSSERKNSGSTGKTNKQPAI